MLNGYEKIKMVLMMATMEAETTHMMMANREWQSNHT